MPDGVGQGAVLIEIAFVRLAPFGHVGFQAFAGFPGQRRGNSLFGKRREVEALGARLGDKIAIERQINGPPGSGCLVKIHAHLYPDDMRMSNAKHAALPEWGSGPGFRPPHHF
jgi:hypothetical protein